MKLTVEPICLRDDGVAIERSDAVVDHALCGADGLLFAGAVLAGRAAPVGEAEDLPVVTKLDQRPERVVNWGAGGALERDCARLAGGERRVELRQRVEHPIRCGRRQRFMLLAAEDLDALGREPDPAGCALPLRIEIGGGDRDLAGAGDRPHQPLLGGGELPVGEQQLEPLARAGGGGAAFGDHRPQVALGRAQPIADRGMHLVMAARPPVQQRLRDAGQLEVPLPAASAALDLKAESGELAGELGPVRRADLALMLQPRPRIGGHEPSVAAVRGVQQDMRVQLWVRHLIGNGASRGVPPARRDRANRLGMQDRVRVHALAQHRHVPDRVVERAVDRDLVRCLDPLTELRRAERPDGADRLRRGERRVQRRDRLTAAADAAQLAAGVGPADIHEAPQLLTGHGHVGVHAEQVSSARPATRSLDPFPVLEVVVAQLRRPGLPLEVLGIPARRALRDLRDDQHPGPPTLATSVAHRSRHTLHALTVLGARRPNSSQDVPPAKRPRRPIRGRDSVVFMIRPGW